MCSVSDCNDPVRVKGLCAKHYARQYRHDGTDFRGNQGNHQSPKYIGCITVLTFELQLQRKE